jgi:hypothetical protein
MSAVDVMIAWALGQRGKPYVYGAAGPGAFDCSGLMEKAAAAAGIRLPRTSQEQRNAGVAVPLDDIQRGDLVTFTYNDGASNPGPGNHVALYVGGGQVVEAARPGVPVRVAPLDAAHIDRVRRIAGGGSTAAVPADDITTGGTVQQAGLQQAGYEAALSLTPWGIPLNPFKLPGYVMGHAESGLEDLAGAGVSAAWDTLGPIILAGLGVAAGLALAVTGVIVAAKPAVSSVPLPIPV